MLEFNKVFQRVQFLQIKQIIVICTINFINIQISNIIINCIIFQS